MSYGSLFARYKYISSYKMKENPLFIRHKYVSVDKMKDNSLIARFKCIQKHKIGVIIQYLLNIDIYKSIK